MNIPKQIESFRVDHDYIVPGMYISRRDGDVVTYDLRTRKPNCGDYMDNRTMHSLEHMFATFIRSSKISDNVIYFGPMGCQTGFYLLVRDEAPALVREQVIKTLRDIVEYEGEVFGASRKECGNYLNLNLEDAIREARGYLAVLEAAGDADFSYPIGEK